jgi:hypothetical protein
MNKMGSKLAQGVRQVMEQSKTPEGVKKQAEVQATAPAAVASKPGPAKVSSKSQPAVRDDEHEILHPERVWPD